MATDKRRITVYVDDLEYSMIEDLAVNNGISMSALFPALVHYYNHHKEHEGLKFNFRTWGWYGSVSRS